MVSLCFIVAIETAASVAKRDCIKTLHFPLKVAADFFLKYFNLVPHHTCTSFHIPILDKLSTSGTTHGTEGYPDRGDANHMGK